MDEFFKFLKSGILSPFKKWGTRWSLWPVHLVTACCGAELAHTFACGYDGERLGALNYGIARQTNLIIVEGAITRKMAKVLKVTWEQMPDPKFVIIMGACGLKGGIFWNSYNLVKPWEVVPVDFFIPGCPPTPEALLRGIRQLQYKISTGESKSSITFKEVEMKSGRRPRILPREPKKISKAPGVLVNLPKPVDWNFGKELCKKLNELLNPKSVVITNKNRIAVRVDKSEIYRAARKLKEMGFDHVKSVNVIDVPEEDKFIVEYHLSSYSIPNLMPVLVNLFCDVPRSEPKIKSLAEIFPSADYMEREMHDFFGVIFDGNEWMGRKFILAPDTPEHPLRKDFELEKESYTR
ncbi:F420H(2):quinone oxidoreductase [Archaeoglobales archaeon ex4484_92]|nr:MAG: F420H(2):quinone oxidoreductase [Archaeoglobales archaeon ex4484_92]